MTRWEKMDARARWIAQGTEEPLSGWHDSPADLERQIVQALQWAYWMGVETLLDAIEPFANYAAERAAGGECRDLPDGVFRRALEAYRDAGDQIDADARDRIGRAQWSRATPNAAS